METCQPYGCSLVMAFGLLVGIAVALLGIVLMGVLRQVMRAWRKRKLDDLQRQVDEVFPNWRNTVRSSRYIDWLDLQSPDVRKLAASWKPKDAIEVLRLYDTRQSSHN